MPTVTTENIRISVRALYLEDRSDPAEERFAFAYQIQIANEGSETVQLRRRHWIITDAGEDVQEVRGLGVVGQHPHLSPGESFTYTSGAVLATPAGQMEGSYQMVGDDGVEFDAMVPPFGLVRRESLH